LGDFFLKFGLNLAIENLNKHMIVAHFKYIESWRFFPKSGLISAIENLKKHMILALLKINNNNNNIAFLWLQAPIQTSPLSFFASILGVQCAHGSNRPLFRSSALHAPAHGLLPSFLLLGFVVWILQKLLFRTAN
jgi:hypothetical protein